MALVFRSLVGAVAGLMLLIALVVGAWALVQWQTLNAPLGTQVRSLTVAKGSTFHMLAQELGDRGLVAQPSALKLYARIDKGVTQIKAGEYAIGPDDSTLSILGRIVRGEVMQRAVTVPEGLNLREIAALVEAAGIASAERFKQLATDAATAAGLGIEAAGLEGYLFPDTYHFARDYGAEGVVRTMVERFRSSLPPDYEDRARAVGLSSKEALVLASIIEKETGAPSERRLISAVFHNRLKKGMRLQSDPTVIYGIEGFDGNIRKKDLLTLTAYNTYRINGLPPTPIANPGLESLLAAVDPAPVPYLYFVSKNDGTHYFSSTLVEHNRAVDLYQRSPRSRKAGK